MSSQIQKQRIYLNFHHPNYDTWKNKSCYIINCQSTKLSSCHSLSESQLRHIAIDGHVLTYAVLETKVVTNNQNGMKRIGVGQAGTFEGFCNAHDNKLFEAIDSAIFQICRRNIILLSLRTICFRTYLTIQKAFAITKYLDDTKNIDPRTDIERLVDIRYHDAYLALEIDFLYLREKYSSAYLDKKFDNFEYCIFNLEDEPWMLGTDINPIFEQSVQAGKPLQEIGCSILKTQNGWAVILSHINLEQNENFKNTVLNLLRNPQKDIPNRLLAFILSSYSNLFFKFKEKEPETDLLKSIFDSHHENAVNVEKNEAIAKKLPQLEIKTTQFKFSANPLSFIRYIQQSTFSTYKEKRIPKKYKSFKRFTKHIKKSHSN